MSYRVNVTAAGTVEVPADLVREAGMRAGDRLTVERGAEGRLVIKTCEQMVRDTQACFRGLAPDGASLVDELISERRAEAAREEAEQDEWLRLRGKL